MSGEKKRGLGRGLSALMADVADVDAQTGRVSDRNDIETLPVDQISPNPDQPRKAFNVQELEELTNSIKEKGVIQPLIVRPHEGTYQIVAGERRWRAAQAAQLHDVPVVIRNFSDTEVLEVAIVENIQRADLNPIEEAQGYRALMDRFGHTQEKLAEALGKSRSYIANLLRLLNLPEDVLTWLQEGQLSIGHARALITSDDAYKLAKQVISKGLSVRETEALVKRAANPQEPRATDNTTKPEKDADTRALEDDLSAALGLKVQLTHSANSENGTMTLHYKSFDQLDELCRKLSSE